MKAKKVLDGLDHSKGGIPETGRINKNREVFFWFDRERYGERRRLKEWLEEKITDIDIGEIDTIVIDVKQRAW